MRLIKLIIALFIISAPVFAQQVVVSEYWNISATPEGEWTELLVVNDNISMVGWKLRDNSEENGWQGGVIFKDVPLWRNIRKGTIIVVNHRDYSSNIDKNKYDGYIEVSADDRSVFDSISYYSGPEYTWNSLALSISQKNDIIQLLDNSNNHVHSLSHNASDVDDYKAITGFKINRANVTVAAARSVSVYPGTSIEKYRSGNTTTEALVGSIDTKGKPNKGSSGQDDNQSFWRELRQPEWSSPSLTASIIPNAVQLSWNKCTDSYPADTATGYLVVRIPKDELASATTPVDGVNYSAGAKYGSSVVLASLNGSDKNSYTDYSNFACGLTFVYRVYAYKYSSDDQNQAANPRNGRGRSYNELNYASKELSKNGIDKPGISSENGVTALCEGDALNLTAIASGNYQYQWYVDNYKIDGATSIIYTTAVSGNYRVRIYDASSGCEAFSNELSIVFYAYPKLKLTLDMPGTPAEFKEVKDNMTITFCDAVSANVKVNGASSIQWFKNDLVYKEPVAEGKTFALYENGVYYAIAKNANLCADTTFKITIKINKPDYDVSPLSLNFNLSSSEAYGEQNITVTNNSSEEFTFESIDNSTNFMVVAPAPPYTVPANGQLVLTIRFNPAFSGDFLGESIVLNTPCDAVTIALTGKKDPSTVTINKTHILYPYILNCEDGVYYDSLITITNLGTDEVTINQPIVDQPYEVSGTFPKVLGQNGTTDLTVRFSHSSEGNYSQDLIIPYTVNSVTKNLVVQLTGAQVLPEFDFTYSDIVMPEFSDAVQSRDTVLIINNNGVTPIIFSEQPAQSEIHYNNIPLTIMPNMSETLSITVTPNSSKIFNLSLIASPCLINGNYSIECKYNSSEYYVSADTIDFGSIIKCPNNVIRDSSFYIKVNGNPINPSITNISVPEGFIINKSNGDALADSTNIIVTFIGNEIKEYKGELSITIMPNNITKKVFLSINLVEPKIVVPDTLLFNSVTLNTLSNSTLQILNNTGMPVEVVSISTPNSPFAMESIALPQIITNAGELNTIFNINVSNYGTYLSDVTIRFRIQGCEFDSIITLKAIIQDDSALRATLDVRNINTDLGNFILPVYIDLHGADYYDVEVNGLSFEMSYNPTVYLPVSIYAEQRIDLSDVYIDDRGPGKVKITMNTPAGANMTDGKLFTIRSKALWGDASYTGIKIEDIKIYAKSKLVVDDDTATVSIINSCGYDNSLIGIDGTPILKINVEESTISVQYGIITNEDSELLIYDMSGNKVFNKNIKSNSGLYTLTIDNDFNSGTYFVKYTNGNISKTQKFIIIK